MLPLLLARLQACWVPWTGDANALLGVASPGTDCSQARLIAQQTAAVAHGHYAGALGRFAWSSAQNVCCRCVTCSADHFVWVGLWADRCVTTSTAAPRQRRVHCLACGAVVMLFTYSTPGS